MTDQDDSRSRFVPFEHSNMVIIVDGSSPRHRCVKKLAQGLLLSRQSPPAPAVTRMVFWNEIFGQYVVQEITSTENEPAYLVADSGSINNTSQLLPVLRNADILVFLTTARMASIEGRWKPGIERFSSNTIQNVPHIFIMLHENMLSTKDVFSAFHKYSSLSHVAFLYQSISLRDSLGPCRALHIRGRLHALCDSGELDGRMVHAFGDWRDLPQLNLGSALLRLALEPRSDYAREYSGRLGEYSLTSNFENPLDSPDSLGRVESREGSPPLDPESLAAANIRRLSYFIDGQPLPDLLTLQRELRIAHRRQSRAPIQSMTISQPPACPIADSFRGECQLCCQEDSQLVFLFKQQIVSASQPTSICWPFAVGADPMNDIISAFICCNNCSSYVLREGLTPIRETATAAFPLVNFNSNSTKWKDSLQRGLSHYGKSPRDLLPVVFFAIVEETLRSKSWAQLDGSEENQQRQKALIWTQDRLLADVQMRGDDHDGPLGEWIFNVVVNPKRAYRSLIWRYPIRGFGLMLRVAARSHAVLLGRVLWQRLLIEITSRYKELYTAGVTYEEVTAMTARLNKMLSGHALATDGWIEYLAVEDVIVPDVKAVLDTMKSEMVWLLANCRFACVLWLSWMPEIHMWPHEITVGVVRIVVDRNCGEIVVCTPEEVREEWCKNATSTRQAAVCGGFSDGF